MSETVLTFRKSAALPQEAGIYVSAVDVPEWPSVALYKLDSVVGDWVVNDRGFWEGVPVEAVPSDLLPVGFGTAVKASGRNDLPF